MQLSVAIRQRIVNLLRENNLSLRRLAKSAGTPYATLIAFMAGHSRTLTLTTLANICYALKIDLVDFFDDKLFKDTYDEHEKNLDKNKSNLVKKP